MKQNRQLGIKVVAVLMIFCGLTGIITGFTYNFLGLVSTASVTLATYGVAAVGALYAIGGVLILAMKKQAVWLAMICLVGVIAGRIALVASGFYPLTSFLQDISIFITTALAIIFAVYIGFKWGSFDKPGATALPAHAAHDGKRRPTAKPASVSVGSHICGPHQPRVPSWRPATF